MTSIEGNGSTNMRAMELVQPAEFRMVELQAPTERDVSDGEVLIRVLAGGVCGSDLPNFKGRLSLWFGDDAEGVTTLPGYPLHEVAGEVVVSRHSELKSGDMVVGWATRFNGIAEYIVTHGDSVYTYSDELSPTDAVLLQPLTCVLHAVDRLDVAGRSVAVIGLGPIGVLFGHVLKTAGAATVVGVDPVDRSAEAAQFGFDVTVKSTSDRWAANLEHHARPEVVVEAVGHQTATLHDAVSAVAEGGTIFHFGVSDEAVVTFPLDAFQRKHLTLISGGTRDRHRWIEEAGRYVAAHPEVLTSVTDVVPFSKTQEAFEIAVRPAAHRFKVVLDMSS